MSKKIYWVLFVFSILSLLTGIPHLAEGTLLRGFGGVNYGELLFPLLGGWAFYKIRLRESA